jgi:ferredoxin--NADP+ reductase
MSDLSKHLVAVIGAGPAGLFAARELANAGVQVILFNRDIKPGGLAEYGIYPSKHKMKEGLRKQFRQILESPDIEYYGNVEIGQKGDLTLMELRALGFQALLVTVGAQGTKWLGLPGEDLLGVFHAKDLVYHYNQLLPMACRISKSGGKWQ